MKAKTERTHETLRRSCVRASTMTLARAYSAHEQHGPTTFMPRPPVPEVLVTMDESTGQPTNTTIGQAIASLVSAAPAGVPKPSVYCKF